MKHDMAGAKENVIACTSVPNDVKDMFMKSLEDKEKVKEANCQDCFEEMDIQDQKRTLESFSRKGKQKTMNEMFKDRELVITDICKCIYGNAFTI